MSDAADTFWFTRSPVPTAFSLAVLNGWIAAELDREGIEFRALAATSDRSARQWQEDQSQPNFFRHGGNVPPLLARAEGHDLRLIGLSHSDSLRVILVRHDSDIRSIADLKGRKVSLPVRVGDRADFWRSAVLRGFADVLGAHGLSLADTVPTRVPVGEGSPRALRGEDGHWGADLLLGRQREEAEALIRGEVEAIWSQGPMAVLLQGMTGARAIFDSQNSTRWLNNDAPLTLTVSGALLDRRPDLVDQVLAQVLRAATWAEEHEQEAKRLIALETGLPEELVDRAFSPDVHAQLGLSLEVGLVTQLESQHRLLLDRGFLETPVDFDRFIDPAPLARAHALLARQERHLKLAVG